MRTFFVQIKCQLGQTYEVASELAEAEIASEIYSIAGDFDILAKFYVEDDVDIGHFIGEKVQIIPGIADTRTIVDLPSVLMTAVAAQMLHRWRRPGRRDGRVPCWRAPASRSP